MPPKAGHTIEVATSAADLANHISAWRHLSGQSLEDNVYLRPEFLIPAFEHRQFEGVPLALFVYECRGDSRDLAMVAAFESRPPTLRIPFRHLQSSAGLHGFLVRPLLAQHRPQHAVRAMLDWLASEKSEWHGVIFRHLFSRSPVGAVLLAELQIAAGAAVRYPTFRRAVLEGVDSFDSYLAQLPAKRRQEFRRHGRNLSAAGNARIDCRVLTSGIADFVQEFADMEMRGWKGREATALASTESSRAFLESISTNFAGSQSLYACEIRLDEQPLAMSLNFLGRETMFGFKIAFDARYRNFSPGIQLIMETIRALLDVGIYKVDSGNADDSYATQLMPVQQQFENVFMPLSLPARAYAKVAQQTMSFRHKPENGSPSARA
jgi:CelD/BcsL family acetyltransferase involved in cellulose biosynthesis